VAVAAADGVEGGAVDGTVGVAIAAAVVVGDSRRQRQNRLGCAAVRSRRGWVVGLNSVSPCGFGEAGRDRRRRCFGEEERMWDTAL
jgi:hypothetical protein